MDALRQSILRAQLAKPLPGSAQKNPPARPAETAALDARVAVLDRKLDTLIRMLRVPRRNRDALPCLLAADIRRAVTLFFDLTDADLDRRTRQGRSARIRQIAYYLCRSHTSLSFPEIGRAFHRDHATILHGVRRIGAMRDTDEALADDLTKLEARLADALAQRMAAGCRTGD